MDNQNNESKLILKKPIIIIINGNYKKHVTNLNMLYNYKKNKKSSLDQYSVIEIIKDIPVKLHLLCKKETNEEEYNNRYNSRTVDSLSYYFQRRRIFWPSCKSESSVRLFMLRTSSQSR